MDITEIVAEIDLEIARLEKAKALMGGQTAPSKRGRPPAAKPKPTRDIFRVWNQYLRAKEEDEC